eukprot:1150974-Pelagomonas_calceolata.AAC.2
MALQTKWSEKTFSDTGFQPFPSEGVQRKGCQKDVSDVYRNYKYKILGAKNYYQVGGAGPFGVI